MPGFQYSTHIMSPSPSPPAKPSSPCHVFITVYIMSPAPSPPSKLSSHCQVSNTVHISCPPHPLLQLSRAAPGMFSSQSISCPPAPSPPAKLSKTDQGWPSNAWLLSGEMTDVMTIPPLNPSPLPPASIHCRNRKSNTSIT
jgi:hypothetical protein